MIKFSKCVNQNTKEYIVGNEQQREYFMDFSDNDLEQAHDGKWYLVGYVPTKPARIQLEEKEKEYNMNRWQREIILAQGSGASEYTKDKAQELEDLAQQIRNNNELTNEN